MVPLAGVLSIAYALNVNRIDDTGQPLGNPLMEDAAWRPAALATRCLRSRTSGVARTGWSEAPQAPAGSSADCRWSHVPVADGICDHGRASVSAASVSMRVWLETAAHRNRSARRPCLRAVSGLISTQAINGWCSVQSPTHHYGKRQQDGHTRNQNSR